MFDELSVSMGVVVLRITSSSSESRVVECCSSMTLDEAATAAGFNLPGDHSTIFVCRGRILAPYLSLGHHRVASGAHIILHRKRGPFPKSTPVPLYHEKAFIYATCEDLESRRLADLGFHLWEMSPMFGTVMSEIVHEIELDNESMSRQEFPTVIHPASIICEAPLPMIADRWAGGSIMDWLDSEVSRGSWS
jgi:hypothetical protein